jgi:lysophospholipid acyltransferase (LPLAT)-like uncharacterized protein
VPDESPKTYEYDSLKRYSFRDRILIRAADLTFYAAIKLIGSTIRWEITGLENVDLVSKADHTPIYCLWHDRIFAGTYFLRHREIVVITSQSLDGEYIARFLKRFGFGTVRGSSSRGGVKALVEMIRLMRDGLPMAFTVDGPRGPRYVAKSGPVFLAKKTGNPLLPFTVECASFWTVGSWDKMQIPKPFTRARFIMAEPVYVPRDANDVEVESKVGELQRSLDELVAEGRRWRDEV